MKDGLLLVDKPTGCTSHDVVQSVRRLLRQKKTGHCGTLDPAATGLLLLTLGRATRLTRFLIRAPKVYEGTVHFGSTTDTYDASGTVVATAEEGLVDGLTATAIDEAMATFRGAIDQVPPAYSAKKVQGRKYYELARKGEEVPREPKQVQVYEFTATDELQEQRLPFRLACSSGTYARSLAHDLGEVLGVGGHLASLRRLHIGAFDLESAISLDKLEDVAPERDVASAADFDPGSVVGGAWIPFDNIPLPFAELTLDTGQENRILQGQTVLSRQLESEEGDWIKLISRGGRFLAVGSVTERIGARGVGVIQPRVVFS
ncbi:MAG: tRNA pseudouridine(55) synthase TruB [Acidobacteriota bacterium]